MRKAFVALLVVLLACFASAALASDSAERFGAVVSGTIYSSETFEPLENVIVSVNTVPEQRFVAKDANYYFVIPSTGNFEIRAKYFEDSQLVLEALENVQVGTDGVFKIDLIMLPALNDENLEEELLGNSLDDEKISQVEFPAEDSSWILPAALLAILTAIMALSYFRKKPETAVEAKSEVKEKPKVLDKNSLEVLQALKERGNRATQKELLEKVHFGEAYLSLVLAELENDGKVKKIKKGRGNIIILKEN